MISMKVTALKKHLQNKDNLVFVGRFINPKLVLKELIFPISKVSLENNKKKANIKIEQTLSLYIDLSYTRIRFLYLFYLEKS